MFQTIKSFGGLHAKCGKCGGTASQNYCEGKMGCYKSAEPLGEHLHRTCAFCSYEWLEKCADNKPE